MERTKQLLTHLSYKSFLTKFHRNDLRSTKYVIGYQVNSLISAIEKFMVFRILRHLLAKYYDYHYRGTFVHLPRHEASLRGRS
jgi:hypothetical protein